MHIPSLLLFASLAATAAPKSPSRPTLPIPLEDFLGPPPARFEKRFLRPARDLKAADALLRSHRTDPAIRKLTGLLNSEMGEHALFDLVNAYREKKDFLKSTSAGETLIRSYPNTVYFDRVRETLDQNDCDQGLVAKGDEAIRALERCLWRAPWKTWPDLEPQATSLYTKLKSANDPLLDPLVAEIIQAIPAGSELRQRLARDISADKLDRLATLARYHTKNASSSSIKAVSPDSDLIDQGIKAVLKGNWKDANSIFLRVPTEFPQSDQLDRAQYWIARTEAKLGHEDEAKKRFEEIFTDNPLTYYGLQAAIYLKRDILPLISQPSSPFAAKWEGALTTRQALSLWRLRALLVSGLVDYAREEAKSLGGYKVGGAGIGQEDPKGALLLAKLFDTGGNYMASFSQAYAALSLDPSLLNRESVSLIFPQPFLDQFESAGELTGVSPLLLLSVAKQESAFLPNAISRADALGLMQLLPVTARTVVPGSDRSDLFDPKVNIRAGGLYMVKLLDKYQGNIALALAAYNAGPYRVSQWMKDLNEAPLMKESFDVDAFIDSIPFNETRKYVGNILRNYAWYKMLSKDESVTSVQELMFQWQKNQKSLAAKIETPKADLALPGPALPPPPQAEAQPIQARPPTPPPATALPANPSANP